MKAKRTILVLLVVMAASLLLVAAVSADTIAGTGWIRAQGDGQAALQVKLGTVHISGDGVLWFKDEGNPDVPTVTGYGRRIEYPNGWVQYIGFNGSFHLSEADEFAVILRGEDINLFAAGRGRVYLEGHGRYIIGHGTDTVSGTWSEKGETLNLSPNES